MTVPFDLTVAICTRDRVPALRRTLARLAQVLVATPDRCEVLVVDDGDTPMTDVAELGAALWDGVAVIRHVRKAPAERGLYLSRRTAVSLARSPLILFLDDDVDLSDGYMTRLLRHFSRDDRLVGVGGIDRLNLPSRLSPTAALYGWVFLAHGFGSGRLSLAGMNYAQALWRSQTRAFHSSFLHGCNMAFRVEALRELPHLPWLRGHSPCEDLVLSHEASRFGALLVDPALVVDHHLAEGGRGDPRRRLAARIVATHAFQRHRGGPRLAVLWASLGLFLKDLAFAACGRGDARLRDVVGGYRDGLLARSSP